MVDTELSEQKEGYFESKTKNSQPRRKTLQLERTFQELVQKNLRKSLTNLSKNLLMAN